MNTRHPPRHGLFAAKGEEVLQSTEVTQGHLHFPVYDTPTLAFFLIRHTQAG